MSNGPDLPIFSRDSFNQSTFFAKSSIETMDDCITTGSLVGTLK